MDEYLQISRKCLNFRLTICDPEDQVPNEDDLKAALNEIGDKVPLFCAIVSHADVAFFSLFPLSLPLEINMG